MMSALEMAAEMKAVAEVEVKKFADLAEAIVAGEKAAEDRGFDMGVASAGTVNTGDKIYSEVELQAEVVPLKEKIVELQAAIDAIGDVDAKIAAAVKAKGLEIATKIKDASVDDLAIAAELEA